MASSCLTSRMLLTRCDSEAALDDKPCTAVRYLSFFSLKTARDHAADT